jgi:CDGSH-type Zn-finger protein
MFLFIIMDKQKNSPKIFISKDGPYLVSGNIPINKDIVENDEDEEPKNWKRGESFPNKEQCSLCRCGSSKNKPFCDGSHIKIRFDGTEVAENNEYNDIADVIKGPNLILKDAEVYCSSARFCHRLGGTWDNTRNSNNVKSREIAIQQACNCPSGRLVAYDKKTSKAIEPKFDKSIGLIEDPYQKISGPLWIKGGIPIISGNGRKYETRNRVNLCRCGQSGNKPFCDGTHFSIGFNDGDKSLK